MKNKAAVELGRSGGRASARRLSPQQRSERARRAAQARWKAPVTSASAIKGLEDVYVIENRLDVAAFIQENRLRGLLLQARNPLHAAFGEGAVKTLTLVTDDEGFKTLFCLVMVQGDMVEARRALRSFDQQWWLARSELASGKLNFDFELV